MAVATPTLNESHYPADQSEAVRDQFLAGELSAL